MTCIECPNGCHLIVDDEANPIRVTGNQCKRGHDFAISELTHPMRRISSTVRTSNHNYPVLPVRVSGDIPKERIMDVMAVINQTVVTGEPQRGDVIIPDVLGLKVDVIATSSMLRD